MKGGEAYPASDLYSLGATCFHLLTEMHPWQLWSDQGYGWVLGWQQHLRRPVSQKLDRVLSKGDLVTFLFQLSSPESASVPSQIFLS